MYFLSFNNLRQDRCFRSIYSRTKLNTLHHLSALLFWYIPILHGVGHFVPRLVVTLYGSLENPQTYLIFHDFVSFNICYVPLRPFFKKRFWNFEKSKKYFSTFLTSKGPPFGKKNLKIIFSNFFCNKPYFFYLNLNSTCS